MGHSAHVILPSLEKMDCQNDAILTSENGERFKVSCNDLRKLDDKSTPPMVMSHETSAEDCMQRCSGVNFTCAAAMYDFGLSSGLQNCYLFDHLPPSQETNADMTLFYLESLSHQFSPPPRNTPGASNKNWVAGAVIGSVLVAGFGIWWSKRMVKKYNRFIFKTRKVKL
jgi:hypothetical protein